MTNGIIDRRQLLATAVVIPLPGLLHRQAGKDVFTMPSHAWHALASAALTARRVSMIGQDVSGEAGAVMASLISDCPGEVSYYRDLYFGIHEPTPEMDAGRLWFDDPKRLQNICAFLRRGGFTVEDADGWTVLCRRKK